MSPYSEAALRDAEISMDPDSERRQFRTVQKLGMFYVSRSDWAPFSVHATASSANAAANVLTAIITSHIQRDARSPLIWC